MKTSEVGDRIQNFNRDNPASAGSVNQILQAPLVERKKETERNKWVTINRRKTRQRKLTARKIRQILRLEDRSMQRKCTLRSTM